MEQQHLTDLAFESLPVHPALMRGLRDAGFTRCTPIQAMALPLALSGKDVAGQAQTGTGKTVAFLLATMNHLLNGPAAGGRKPNSPRAIIVSPTRELAIQIHSDALQLGAHTGLSLGLVYGGIDYVKQRELLERGVDILIGTPGRIIDYHKQRVFDLRAIEVAVIDEADRMFDLGFIRDVRYLFRRMPPPTERLSMLFSATLSLRVHELAYEHMNNPEEVAVAPDRKTVDLVTQMLYHVESREKLPLLVGLLRGGTFQRTLVFVNTKRTAEALEAHLRANGLEASCLTGDVHQRRRQRLIRDFASGVLPILVATDVAARGLHIPGVSHVINFDLPQNAEDYVHRIGRTARAGESGDAISFACEEFVYSLADIEEFLGHKIPAVSVTDAMLAQSLSPVGPRRRERRRHGAEPGTKRRSRPRRRAARQS
jgi:ATP-dependent RNA helicase RhlB